MKEKYIQLIIILQNAEGFITGGELAKKLNVSDRTIRNYIKDLNENYLVGASIKNNHKGYILVGEINDIKQTQHKEFEARVFFIVKYLLDKDDWATYEEIGAELLFSGQTIRGDVLRIQQEINGYGKVEIRSEIFKGVKLLGEEIDKRLFLDSLSISQSVSMNDFEKLLSYYYKDWFISEELNFILARLKTLFKEENILLETERFLAVVSFVIICLKRIKDNKIIDKASKIINQYEITETKEYEIAKSIMSEVAMLDGVAISEGEISYLSFYLISQRIFLNSSSSENMIIPSEIRMNVEIVLNQMSDQYGMNFYEDQILMSGLNLHLARDLFPLLFNFQIENSYLGTIKKEYIPAYNIAVTFSHLISKKLNLFIPESEIGYFGLHFASFIERKNKKNINIAIVETRNRSLSSLMKNKIENIFPEINIQSIIPIDSLQKLDNEIQLLITPIPLIPSITTPFVQVEPLISQRDILELRKMIDRIQVKKILNITSVHHFSDRTNISDILHIMSKDMGLEDMADSVLERESISSTDVGNGIAIPHPLNESKIDEIKIGLGIIERPIPWGQDSVDIVFLVIPGKDKQNQMSKVFEQLYKFIKNKTNLSKVKEIKSVEELEYLFKIRE